MPREQKKKVAKEGTKSTSSEEKTSKATQKATIDDEGRNAILRQHISIAVLRISKAWAPGSCAGSGPQFGIWSSVQSHPAHVRDLVLSSGSGPQFRVTQLRRCRDIAIASGYRALRWFIPPVHLRGAGGECPGIKPGLKRQHAPAAGVPVAARGSAHSRTIETNQH